MRDPLPDPVVAAAAVTAAVACWWNAAVPVIAVVTVIVVLTHLRGGGVVRVASILLVVGGLATVRADSAWDGLTPRSLGPYEGWVGLVDDPQPFGPATRVVVRVDDERFEIWARGRAIQRRVANWHAGELVLMHGERLVLAPARQQRVAWQHVVGEFRMTWVSDVRVGAPVARASNRVRATLERGAAVLPGDDGSLFRGLVIGDDRDQPRTMIDRFRASGMSHLTAVSGQNVSFVLIAAGPLLRVMRPWSRWMVTLGLIAWFVSLTRFEPSIVRAGVMASLSATAFVLGRERAPTRILWLAVTGLLVIDPLLVRSIGFILSVGATAGVAAIGPPLARRLRWLGFLAMPVAITLGAQCGVVVPVVLVFGRLPLVSVPANLMAVPVAGFVMLYGLPAGLAAGALPSIAPVVMFPCRVGVRWVDTVALLAARLEPGGTATWVGWGVLVVAIVVIAQRGHTRE